MIKIILSACKPLFKLENDTKINKKITPFSDIKFNFNNNLKISYIFD